MDENSHRNPPKIRRFWRSCCGMGIPVKSNFWLSALVGMAILLLSGFVLFGPTGRDDVYKTLWPALTFGESGQILNYNGEALEQSSSLLHVVLLGSISKLTNINLPDLNFLLILGCGLVAVLLSLRMARRLGVSDLFTLGILAGTQPVFTYWAFGGLDGVLAAVAWLVLVDGMRTFLGHKRLWGLILGILMVITARPEGCFVLLSALSFLVLYSAMKTRKNPEMGDVKSTETKSLILVSVIGILSSSLLVGWRIWHSGYWLPQTAIAKSGGFGWEKSIEGMRYLWHATLSHPELLVLWVGLGIGVWNAIRGKLSVLNALILSISLAGVAFVVFSGGDWMENGRFLVPYLPLLLVNAFFQLETIFLKWVSLFRFGWIALSLVGLVWTARYHNTGYSPLLHSKEWTQQQEAFFYRAIPFSERYNRVHLRDIQPLAALRLAVDEVYSQDNKPVTVLSQQAGMMAFHLAETHRGKFRFIDLVGLCTADFTDCAVTKDRGNFRGGLNMDLIYLMQDLPKIESECGISAPDIVFGLDDEAGTLRQAMIARGYRLAYLQEGNMPKSHPWFPGLEIDAIEFIVVRE